MSIQLEVTEDQSLFRETTVRFIESELPLTATREWHERDDGFDPAWLVSAAELGWFSMLVPESDGGGSVSGAPIADAALIAEQLGRYVQPGPFVPMNVALWAIARHGAPGRTAELLPAAIAGQQIVTWAAHDVDGNWDLGAGVSVTATADGLRVSGARGQVQDAGQADLLLVAGTLDGRPVQVLVPRDTPGVRLEPLATLDLARRMANVAFDDVEVPADALVERDAETLGSMHRLAAVLAAAETVGAMDALFAMTVEYAKDRIAFGRPIGSFQALKHLMADLALNLEVAKAAAAAAIGALDRERDDAAEVVAMAAAAIAESGDELAQQCLQIHGGIGYTWEHDLHLLMRRIQTNGVLYGTATWHREQLCRFHRLGEEATR